MAVRLSNRDTKDRLTAEFENVRAVASASIKLDGLTVLTGPNGCGKSTIVCTLQDSVEAALYCQNAIRHDVLKGFYSEYVSPLKSLISTVDKSIEKDVRLEFDGHASVVRFNHDYSLDTAKQWRTVFEHIFGGLVWERIPHDTVRLMMFRRTAISSEIKSNKDVAAYLMKKCDWLLEQIEAARSRLTDKDAFEEGQLTSNYLWEGRVRISENGNLAFGYDGPVIAAGAGQTVKMLDSVIYIVSPLVSMPRQQNDEMLRIDRNLVPFPVKDSKYEGETAERISDLFRDLLKGEVVKDKTISGSPYWSFVRDDNEKFDLDDCATGYKGLSILYILYSQGCLEGDKLLIIDEPEAHLHPEFVVAYARLLLLLLIQFPKLRVCVASHSPDMVNALQSFALSANFTEFTHIYQAVPVSSDNRYQFVFHDRKISVAKVFESFNTVYSLIDDYSARFREGK